jgi:type I restriction enzyme S subunit
MKGWATKTIGELCDAGGGRVQTGPFGSQLHESDYSDTGIPVVMPKDILGGRIDESSIARVSDAHVDRLRRHKLSKSDIVYGRRGDIGRQALIRDENVGWLCGTGCLRITLGNASVLPDFLHRYLQLSAVIRWIQGQAIGATMPNLNTNILRRMPVAFPVSDKTQQKVVAILSAYDELIENNQRRIGLLEKLGEEIYREWFVRLRFPGHEKVKVVKGVPTGWEVRTLGTFAGEVKRGVKKKDLADNERYVGLEHIPRRSIALKQWATADTVESNKLLFQERDILFGKIRPYLHKVVLSHISGACSSDTIVIRPKEKFYEGYLLFTVFSDTFIELATVASKGTKMPRADWGFLKKLELAVPEKNLLELYQAQFDSVFAQIVNLLRANELLANSRDLLLPRLISGKLSVENLDIQFPPGMAEESDMEPTTAVSTETLANS